MNTTPTTELEAVNEMLGTIGESPVMTIEDNGVVDASIAYQILTSVSRAIQSTGWHFNTELAMEISPAFPSKNLVLPNNILRVDTVESDADVDLVQRGLRLYNRVDHTYEFTRPYCVEMVLMLNFTELPEAARYYVTIRAARVFQERTVGSSTLTGFTEKDEMWAKIGLQDADGDTKDANILKTSSAQLILER